VANRARVHQKGMVVKNQKSSQYKTVAVRLGEEKKEKLKRTGPQKAQKVRWETTWGSKRNNENDPERPGRSSGGGWGNRESKKTSGVKQQRKSRTRKNASHTGGKGSKRLEHPRQRKFQWWKR